jgi:hypothetical protein
MASSLRISTDPKISPFEGFKVLEKEFGKGVFSKVGLHKLNAVDP